MSEAQPTRIDRMSKSMARLRNNQQNLHNITSSSLNNTNSLKANTNESASRDGFVGDIAECKENGIISEKSMRISSSGELFLATKLQITKNSTHSQIDPTQTQHPHAPSQSSHPVLSHLQPQSLSQEIVDKRDFKQTSVYKRKHSRDLMRPTAPGGFFGDSQQCEWSFEVPRSHVSRKVKHRDGPSNRCKGDVGDLVEEYNDDDDEENDEKSEKNKKNDNAKSNDNGTINDNSMTTLPSSTTTNDRLKRAITYCIDNECGDDNNIANHHINTNNNNDDIHNNPRLPPIIEVKTHHNVNATANNTTTTNTTANITTNTTTATIIKNNAPAIYLRNNALHTLRSRSSVKRVMSFNDYYDNLALNNADNNSLNSHNDVNYTQDTHDNSQNCTQIVGSQDSSNNTHSHDSNDGKKGNVVKSSNICGLVQQHNNIPNHHNIYSNNNTQTDSLINDSQQILTHSLSILSKSQSFMTARDGDSITFRQYHTLKHANDLGSQNVPSAANKVSCDPSSGGKMSPTQGGEILKYNNGLKQPNNDPNHKNEKNYVQNPLLRIDTLTRRDSQRNTITEPNSDYNLRRNGSRRLAVGSIEGNKEGGNVIGRYESNLISRFDSKPSQITSLLTDHPARCNEYLTKTTWGGSRLEDSVMDSGRLGVSSNSSILTPNSLCALEAAKATNLLNDEAKATNILSDEGEYPSLPTHESFPDNDSNSDDDDDDYGCDVVSFLRRDRDRDYDKVGKGGFYPNNSDSLVIQSDDVQSDENMTFHRIQANNNKDKTGTVDRDNQNNGAHKTDDSSFISQKSTKSSLYIRKKKVAVDAQEQSQSQHQQSSSSQNSQDKIIYTPAHDKAEHRKRVVTQQDVVDDNEKLSKKNEDTKTTMTNDDDDNTDEDATNIDDGTKSESNFCKQRDNKSSEQINDDDDLDEKELQRLSYNERFEHLFEQFPSITNPKFTTQTHINRPFWLELMYNECIFSGLDIDGGDVIDKKVLEKMVLMNDKQNNPQPKTISKNNKNKSQEKATTTSNKTDPMSPYHRLDDDAEVDNETVLVNGSKMGKISRRWALVVQSLTQCLSKCVPYDPTHYRNDGVTRKHWRYRVKDSEKFWKIAKHHHQQRYVPKKLRSSNRNVD